MCYKTEKNNNKKLNLYYNENQNLFFEKLRNIREKRIDTVLNIKVQEVNENMKC